MPEDSTTLLLELKDSLITSFESLATDPEQSFITKVAASNVVAGILVLVEEAKKQEEGE